MKTNSSELFDTIKSLSTQEKKRIRKEMSQNNKDKKTLLLYDLIDKQKKFDDAAIQKKLGHPKWYPQLKKYLLERLTDKIFSGNPDKKNYTYVLRLITIAEQFYAKGLFKQSQKKFEQAADTCKKNDWLEYIPIINARLSNIIGTKHEQRKNYIFYTEAYQALNQSYLEKKYSLLFRCLEFSNKTMQSKQLINNLNINECLSDETRLTTLLQKLHYYQFLASYYKNIEINHSQSYFYCKKYLDVVVKKNQEDENKNAASESQKTSRERNNIVGLLNVIVAAINANLFEDLNALYLSFLDLKNKFNIKDDHSLALLFEESRLILYLLISTSNITRRGLEHPDFDFYLRQFYHNENKLPRPTSTSCNELIAFTFFMKKKWADCTASINKIVNDNEIYKIYSETYANILLLRLFVNYETGDLDILDFNLKKTERYFGKRYWALPYENLILSFFNEITINGQAAHFNILKKYKSHLDHLLLTDRSFAATYLAERIFIDFGCWLDSRITNKPLRDVLKEKWNKN
ncbi:MAG: hypothetical protein HYU69_00460 [Bacteroidetes bacterium]|nr:hypothetical protein [Bacteroidota bacterium]